MRRTEYKPGSIARKKALGGIKGLWAGAAMALTVLMGGCAMGPGSAPPPPGWVPPSGGRAVMADRYCFENEYGEKICTDSPKFREEYIKETQLPYRFWEDKRSEELLRGPQGYPYGPDYPQNQYDPRYQQFLRRGYGR